MLKNTKHHNRKMLECVERDPELVPLPPSEARMLKSHSRRLSRSYRTDTLRRIIPRSSRRCSCTSTHHYGKAIGAQKIHIWHSVTFAAMWDFTRSTHFKGLCTMFSCRIATLSIHSARKASQDLISDSDFTMRNQRPPHYWV